MNFQKIILAVIVFASAGQVIAKGTDKQIYAAESLLDTVRQRRKNVDVCSNFSWFNMMTSAWGKYNTAKRTDYLKQQANYLRNAGLTTIADKLLSDGMTTGDALGKYWRNMSSADKKAVANAIVDAAQRDLDSLS